MFLNGKNKVTDLWIWLFSKGQLREQERGRTNGEREWMKEQDPQSRWQMMRVLAILRGEKFLLLRKAEAKAM